MVEMRTKVAVAVAAVVLILAAAGGIVWYVSVPHSAEEQLALAEKLYKKLNADSVTHKYPENKADVEATIKAYRDVAAWKKPDATYEGLKRIEQIQEEIVGSKEEAIKVWKEIIGAYPEEERGGAAMMAMEGLIRKQADALKSIKKDEEANARYKDALGVLDDYLKKYPMGKLADAATIEQGRIWQDGIGDPLANAIAIYEKFLKIYVTSEYVPEAMYRLAQILQMAKADDRAMSLYSELLEKYPKSKWSDKALFERGKLLAAKMKPDEAQKDFEKLSKEFPDSPLKGEAQGAAKQAKGESAKQAGEKYGRSRYGGTVPYDTSADKPIPPAGMLKVYAKEKLDAQDYDLDIAFEPSDHKMSVKGWMTLINRGDDKTQLLLMLGGAMKVTTCNVDGVAAKNELSGVQWRIILPKVMKTGAFSRIDFEYSCRMAAPKPGMGFGKMSVKSDPAPDVGPGGDAATQPATESASSQPADEHLPYDPQLALGDFGYGLSGGNFYPVTIIGDLFNAHVHATLPAGDEVVFSGAVVKRSPGTGTTRGEFEFKTSRPIFGLYFAYGKYVVAQKVVNGITYYTYLKEADKDKNEAYVKTASDILNFYSDRYTAFPYEKLALVEVPLPPFLGGVGPASLMFLHQGMVMQHDVPEFLLAHELAHQWFGNLIPINMTDPGYNQWLSEGFATYSDALYSQQTGPADSLAKHMQKYAQLYFEQSLAFPRAVERPIKDTFQDSPMYRPMIYEKGAMVLHALRKVVGDEHFFTIMRRYVNECKDKPTTVGDFRRLAQEVGGKDLSIFFSQWIDRPGFAHWVIRGADMENASGEPATTQAGAATMPSAAAPTKVTLDLNQPDDLFVMPADITYHGDAGQVFVQKDVMLDQIEQKVTAVVPFKPVKIVIDEDYWVMHHPGEDNVWTAAGGNAK